MKIYFNNIEFVLNSDGSMYWQSEDTLILGDLHLEKSTYFNDVGNFLPPYDTLDTLLKLLDTLKNYSNTKRIILLGDIFHDSQAYSRLKAKEKAIFNQICSENLIVWIYGNHDKDFKPLNVNSYDNYIFKKINFCHIPNLNSTNEISGHYHPKVSFFYLGKKITKPCFLVDKNKIILPAFGSYAGGLDVKSNIYQSLLKKNFKIYALGNNKVIPINLES